MTETSFRFSVRGIPCNSALAKDFGVPLGVLIRPMQLNCDNYSNEKLSTRRCRHCKAFLNPYITLVPSTLRWKCNFCGTTNELPQLFHERDFDTLKKKLPILSYPALQMELPAGYDKVEAGAVAYCFIFDVSQYAIRSNQLQVGIASLVQILPHIPDGILISLILVDSSIHIFHFKNAKSYLLTMHCDIVPHYPFFLQLTEKVRPMFIKTLQSIPHLFSQNTDLFCNVSLALSTANRLMSFLSVRGGGFITFSLSSPESIGSLNPSEDSKLAENMKSISFELLNRHTTIHLFISTSGKEHRISFYDQLIHLIGGDMHLYSDSTSDLNQYSVDIQTVVATPTGSNVHMRVNISNGIDITNYFGDFFVKARNEMTTSSIDETKTVGFKFNVSNDLYKTNSEMGVTSPFCYFQFWITFTSMSIAKSNSIPVWKRYIRVFTIALPLISEINSLYNSIDQDALIALLLRDPQASQLNTTVPKDIFSSSVLYKSMKLIFENYKKNIVTALVQMDQLTCPVSLNMFSRYVHGMIKQFAINFINSDQQFFRNYLYQRLPVDMLVKYLYPRLYNLTDLPPDCGIKDQDGAIQLPLVPLSPSSAHLSRNSIFLLDSGNQLILWIGKDITQDTVLLQQLFGVSELPGDLSQIESYGEEESHVPARIVRTIQVLQNQHYPIIPKLLILSEDSPQKTTFYNKLVDDRIQGIDSFFHFESELNTLK